MQEAFSRGLMQVTSFELVHTDGTSVIFINKSYLDESQMPIINEERNPKLG